MNQITRKIIKYLNMAFISWLLAPLTILLGGTFLGARKMSFHFYPFFLLYLFLLLVKAMETALLKRNSENFQIPLPIQISFYALVTIDLILIFVSLNWLVVFLLFLYFAFIFVAFHERIRMETTEYYLLLQLFFQTFIIGFISYYAQTGFLTAQTLLYFLPILFLILPILLNQQKDTILKQKIRVKNSFYPTLLMEKTPLLTLISFIIAIILIVILFIINKAAPWKYILFLILLSAVLLPAAFQSVRKAVRTELYIADFAFLMVFLYSVLLNAAV